MKALLTYIKGKILIVHIFEKRNISIEGRIVKYCFYSQLLSLIAVTGNFCIKINT